MVLPLVAAPAAEAQGIKWVKLCGPSACNKVADSELDFRESPLVFRPG